jgi:hypothetical protein
MTGRVANWTKFLVNGQPLTNFGSPPSSNLVNICVACQARARRRRSMRKILGSPCIAGALVALRSPGNPITGPVGHREFRRWRRRQLHGRGEHGQQVGAVASAEHRAECRSQQGLIATSASTACCRRSTTSRMAELRAVGELDDAVAHQPRALQRHQQCGGHPGLLQKFATNVAQPDRARLQATRASCTRGVRADCWRCRRTVFAIDNDADGLFDTTWPVTAYTRKPSGVVNNCIGSLHLRLVATAPFRAEGDNQTDGD